MPGLPFGAAQQCSVPDELKTYEHVRGIEFIELDPNLPYPRSAAYRKVEDGGQMLIRKAVPELIEVDLTREEAAALIDALRAEGVFDWQRTFKPSQGTFVDVATEWRIEVDFDQRISRRSSKFRSEGEDEFPDSFDAVVKTLLGQAPDPVEAPEHEDV